MFGRRLFPSLSAALIERVRAVSKVRHVLKGEILFEPGDTGVPFFVLLSGAMEIVQPDLTSERLDRDLRCRDISPASSP